MGAAKRRGTEAQRIAWAIDRQKAEREAREERRRKNEAAMSPEQREQNARDLAMLNGFFLMAAASVAMPKRYR